MRPKKMRRENEWKRCPFFSLVWIDGKMSGEKMIV